MSDILLLDNFDSFTYNLVDTFRSFEHHVDVYRNNIPLKTLILTLSDMENPILILSPGPGTLQNSGKLLYFIKKLKGKIPILGICLGHQALIYFYRGIIYRAPTIVHGKSSYITHDKKICLKIFQIFFLGARYHSLLCKSILKSLKINAKYDNLVMGIKNSINKICSFQFHPESILTPKRDRMIKKIQLHS